MDKNVNAKLTAAWRAAVARLIEAGYEPGDVYATMIKVGLSFAEDQVNDKPEPSAQVRPKNRAAESAGSRALDGSGEVAQHAA